MSTFEEPNTRKCLSCQSPVEGRKDKLYCSHYCKSAFHYNKQKEKEDSLYLIIDQQLKRNRSLLKHFNAAGKAVIRKSILLKEGFNPKYFTHYWKNAKGEVYLFCYEYGFLAKSENYVQKYVLIKWQDYMNSNSK